MLQYGYAAHDAKQYAASETAVRHALDLTPADARLWDLLGNDLEAQGHKAQALSAYQKALQLDPSNQDAKSGVARLSRGN